MADIGSWRMSCATSDGFRQARSARVRRPTRFSSLSIGTPCNPGGPRVAHVTARRESIDRLSGHSGNFHCPTPRLLVTTTYTFRPRVSVCRRACNRALKSAVSNVKQRLSDHVTLLRIFARWQFDTRHCKNQ